MKQVLILSDNVYLLTKFRALTATPKFRELKAEFRFSYSAKNQSLHDLFKAKSWVFSLDVNENLEELISDYDLLISLHSRQFFPKRLVEEQRCINVHPGYNPHNRGWYPQVFSIINDLPVGVTIHEMDEKLDHGPIIVQKKIVITDSDTSLSAYNRILELELELLEEWLERITNNNYLTTMAEEGNLNLKSDFDDLCELNLQEHMSLKEAIDRLRALSHGDYLNAYYVDENGNKVFVKLDLITDKT